MVLVLIFVVPIYYVIFLRNSQLKIKIYGISALLLLCALLAYTDVFLIALESKTLCEEEAGLHIYKNEPSNSFVGSTEIERWQKHGFKYVEYESISSGKKRYTYVDGKRRSSDIEEFSSLYEVAIESNVIGKTIKRNKKFVRNRETGQTLGEVIYFHIYPGWLDRILLGMLGFSWTIPTCDGGYRPGSKQLTLLYSDDLILGTLKPIQGKY